MSFFPLRSRLQVSPIPGQVPGILDKLERFLTTIFCFLYAVEGGRISDEMDSFYRLFIVPGMGHCHGGPGAWKFAQGVMLGRDTDGINQTDHSVMLSIVDWVENGRPPAVIIGTDDEGVEREHCMWPSSKTVWTERGWVCRPV